MPTRADEETTKLERAACSQLALSEHPEPELVEVAPTRKVKLSEIFEPPYGRRGLMLWIFQFFQTVGYYGFGTLAPLVLKAKGYMIVDTLGYHVRLRALVVADRRGRLPADRDEQRVIRSSALSGSS